MNTRHFATALIATASLGLLLAATAASALASGRVLRRNAAGGDTIAGPALIQGAAQ